MPPVLVLAGRLGRRSTPTEPPAQPPPGQPGARCRYLVVTGALPRGSPGWGLSQKLTHLIASKAGSQPTWLTASCKTPAISLQRHLQNMLFYHKGLRVHKKLLPFVACDRKAMILRMQIWSAH